MDPKLRGTNAKYEEMWVETSGDSWETVMAKVGSEECPWNIGNLVKDKSNRRTQYFYCRGCGRKGRLKEIIIGDEVVFETVGDSCDWRFTCGEFLVVRRGELSQWYCHCENFTRDHVCQHSLAVQVYLEEVFIPFTASSFAKQAKGVGRSRKNNKYGKFRDDEHGHVRAAAIAATEQATLSLTQDQHTAAIEDQNNRAAIDRLGQHEVPDLSVPLPSVYTMMDDGGCLLHALLSHSENKHPLTAESMHLFDEIISFMSDNPDRIVPMLIGDRVYTLKDYVESGLLNNFVVVDLAVEGRIEVPNLDYAGLLLFMKQRNTIGIPRCWLELCYVGFAASTVIGKNIVVYDSIGYLLEACRPFEGTAEQTVHLCFNGTNHFERCEWNI